LALSNGPRGSGALHSGRADRSSGCCCLRIRGSGYVPPHVGAVVERRDEAEEAKQFSQQGLRNSRASLRAGFFFRIRASKQVVAGGQPGWTRVSSDATAGWTRTRPENTGAGSEKHGGTKCADFPGRVVMGLHDASNGAHGDFCLCGRNRVFTQN